MAKATKKKSSTRQRTIYDQSRSFQDFLGDHAETFDKGAQYRHHTEASHQVLFDGETEAHGHSFSEHEQKQRIAACREMYRDSGIVGNMVDIMVDFALEKITIEHTNPSVRNIYRNWAKRVNLFKFSESFLKSYYRDGHVPILKIKARVTPEEVRRLRKRVFADQKKQNAKFLMSKSQFEMIPESEKGRIPVKYRLLDVLKLHKKGSEILGTSRYQYQVSRDELDGLKSPQTPEERRARDRFKKSLGDDVFDGFVQTGKIRLPDNRFDVVFYKKDDWEKWSTPMMWRINHDVRYKQLLRNMDISLAEGVQNAVTIVKLGNSEKGFTPSKKSYTKMIDMMKNPAKSKTLVWDDMISVETIYPPVEKMLSAEKYQQVNDDTRSGVGIPEVLLNGTAGNFSNSFLSVKTLMERLETGRQILLQWLQQEVEEIAQALGLQKPAWLKMGRMTLNDEEVERTFVLELMDRNVMSARTLMERVGENIDIEVHRMREEDELRKELREDGDEFTQTMRKLGKFGPQIQEDPLTVDLMEDSQTMAPVQKKKQQQELPSGQEPQGKKGGRPRGGPRRDRKETAPKRPRGQKNASSIDASVTKQETSLKFVKLFDFFTTSLAKSKEGGKLSDITQDELNKVYNSILKVICQLDGSKRISKKQIAQVLQPRYPVTEAGAKLERCVKSVVRQRSAEFRKKNGKPPSADKMKDITSSAFAICRSQGLK
jgi:hypothetical protein